MAFFYKDHSLHIGNDSNSLDLQSFSRSKEHPFYIYDLDMVEENFKIMDQGLNFDHKIHFAVKANSHPKILAHLARLGAGADVVSQGEIELALKAGFLADTIIFSGVGKTKRELEFAIQTNIKQINVESAPELKRIAELSVKLNTKTKVALRFNPDVNPVTHPYITTGFKENKFGMDWQQVEECLEVIKGHSHLELMGLTLHIGSQLLDLQSLEDAILKTLEVEKEIRELGYQLGRFDVGGGVGVFYDREDIKSDHELLRNYLDLLNRLLKDYEGQVQLEPGRSIVARSGLLISEIQYVKETSAKTFAILSAGMNHFMRPSLYQAFHRLLPLTQKDRPKKLYDVVGPICESSDCFGKDRLLPELEEGDFMAIADTGAYGSVMANTYNAHPLPEEFVYYRGDLI